MRVRGGAAQRVISKSALCEPTTFHPGPLRVEGKGRFVIALVGGSLALVVTSCTSNHNALAPAGPNSAHILWLGSIYFWVCVAVWMLVVTVMLLAIWKRGRVPHETYTAINPVVPTEPPTERRRAIVVGTLVGLTAITLIALLFGDLVTNRALASMARISSTNALTIKVNGRQWWWELRYEDAIPSNIFVTANEIHIPTGRPVKFELESADVIHSFWIPNLHGKKDLVPGYKTDTWLQADRAGTYEGRCAEYCGYQHAKMRLVLVAEPTAKFQSWLQSQRSSAPSPTNDSQKRGLQVFLSTTCVMCHTVAGTPARGSVGPSLTHIASRKMIGANSLANTRAQLASWIQDPQHLKPGVRMPQHHLSSDDLNALLNYLETLK
jgi:cytochrome c oxidase subunit II